MRRTSLFQNYRRLPVAFIKGEGAWLWDTAGRKYLDALSGVAVCSLGHAHPAVVSALCTQSKKLIHTSNLYEISAQEQLGQQLTAIAGMAVAFFCNSGTEANEAAIKLARLVALERGNKNPVIITMNGAFHGRTFGAFSAANPGNSEYGPLLPGFHTVPFQDIAALRDAGEKIPGVCAVMLEPVQGEGGVRPASDDYLREVRSLCDEQGWLMILDEVQTGVGRTGDWYCFQHSGIKPDVLCTAKALGNGVPIGACLASRELAKSVSPGKHGSTFGGNPLCCAVASAVLQAIMDSGLLARAREVGARILERLTQLQKEVRCIRDVRGRGMMIGIELSRPCGELVQEALDEGLLINVTATNVVRLLPPLIISDEQVDLLLEKLHLLLKRFDNTETTT